MNVGNAKDINVKEMIKAELINTERPGIENLIQYMEDNGFFTAPCSGANHLCREGGLAEHSWNVLCCMDNFANTVYGEHHYEMYNSIILCALLHDLGKMGDFGKNNYLENWIKDGRPTKAEPEQKWKQSETKPYVTNPNLYYCDHEIRSVKIASKFIELTEEEEQAILWHNGLYSIFKYQIQGKETPLYMLLHFADLWCSRVVEPANEKKEREDAAGELPWHTVGGKANE